MPSGIMVDNANPIATEVAADPLVISRSPSITNKRYRVGPLGKEAREVDAARQVGKWGYEATSSAQCPSFGVGLFCEEV